MISIDTMRQLRTVRANPENVVSPKDLTRYLGQARDALPAVEASTDLYWPLRRLEPVGAEVEARYGIAGRGWFVAAFVAELAIHTASLLSSSKLPDSIKELYPSRFSQLATYLTTSDLTSYWTGDVALLKDLRIAAGYSVPAGAQDVDIYGQIGRRSGLKTIITAGAFRIGWTVIKTGGPQWYAIHTDSRYLDDFNEVGWNHCYVRIADMLTRNPNVRGMVGSSWFYDPQLLTISPRLAYLQTTPLHNGALLLRNGPGAIHTERAIARSATRRKLAEEGSYVPACYTIIWPRDHLIAWAQSQRV